MFASSFNWYDESGFRVKYGENVMWRESQRHKKVRANKEQKQLRLDVLETNWLSVLTDPRQKTSIEDARCTTEITKQRV